MIRQPDSGARPSVTVAATGFLALPVCLGAGLSQWGTGGYPGSTSVAAGCLIVAGIMAVPFAVGLLARVAPGLLAPWVPGDGLFFRAVPVPRGLRAALPGGRRGAEPGAAVRLGNRISAGGSRRAGDCGVAQCRPLAPAGRQE
jgi:hypothetical protein